MKNGNESVSLALQVEKFTKTEILQNIFEEKTIVFSSIGIGFMCAYIFILSI
jgi:hypothetical protein